MVRKLYTSHDTARRRHEAKMWADHQAVTEAEALQRLDLPHQYRREAWSALFDEYVNRGVALAEPVDVRMGGAGAIDFLFACAMGTRPTNIVETGVAYGWSSLAFLVALDILQSGALYSVDMPYPLRYGESWVGVVVPEDLRARWRLIRRPDRYGLVHALQQCPGGIDVAHYDSDKSYFGRKWAYPRLWSALNEDGVFISDDIDDNFCFREFVEAKDANYVVIEHEGRYVGAVKKC
jgi:predicted O-methyltransferase YrrM